MQYRISSKSDIDKRERKVELKATAKSFRIGKTTLVSWKQKLEPERARNKSATKIDMEALKEDVMNYPDSHIFMKGRSG
ncbi:MAG: IS630 transposase-related protein [Rickettsia endosymbiont of Pentastiridius leporinus]